MKKQDVNGFFVSLIRRFRQFREPDKKGNTMLETVYDGAPETFDVVLTPMMAAKWFEDNTNPRPAAPVTPSEKKPQHNRAEAPFVQPTNPADRKDAPNVPDKRPNNRPKTEPMVGEEDENKDLGALEM